MDSKFILRSLLIWILIIPLAVLNGVIRDVIVAPILGAYALPVSGITLIFMIWGVCWSMLPRLGKVAKENTYVFIGILWIILTVIFECTMGFFAMGYSLDKIFSAYDIRTGNLWALVVLFVGCVPVLTAKFKKNFLV